MLISQSGPGAGRWLSARPTCAAQQFKAVRLQVSLRRRLRWPLPLGPRLCNGASCRQPLDATGDHWASCTRSGRVKRRSRPYERTWARIFREAGGRVQENVALRDMGAPGIGAADGRRLEILVTGLPLYSGVPLGVDATIVSPLHGDGTPWPHAAQRAGVALRRAEAAKDRAYPELVRSPVVRLVTVAVEVGGRFSETSLDVLRRLAGAKARSAPEALRAAARAAWLSRWATLLSVAVQDALAATLVDDAVLPLDGVDGEAPPAAAVWLDRE